MPTIRVYHSHIEVTPYKAGDCIDVERASSKWDPVYHTWVPVAFFIQDETLYLPRGFSINMLENKFNTTPIPSTKCDSYTKFKSGVAKLPPKSTTQENAIKFLTAEDDYSYTGRYSQLGLNLETGAGKTYAAVTAILKLKIKSIIIVHQAKILNQWIQTFEEKTTFNMDNLLRLTTSGMRDVLDGKISADIYITTHQTIAGYAREYGWDSVRDVFKKMKVGIKVIDESHKFFDDIFMIDNFSNCYKSWYLTATFGRGDFREVNLYKKSFSSLVRFGKESAGYDEERKHIIMVICYFRSRPEYGVRPNVRTGYGFSTYKYIDYELRETNNSLIEILHKILDETERLEGKTVILSPKKDSLLKIAEDVTEYTGEEVGTIYSDNTEEKNDENKGMRYISTTEKSIGEGADIEGIRVLINLTPIGNPLLADQVAGRLRQYSDDTETMLFYPVDITLPDCTRLLKKIMPAMKKKCKEIITLNMEVQ